MRIIDLKAGGFVEVNPCSIPSYLLNLKLHNGGSLSVLKSFTKEEAESLIEVLQRYVESQS